MLLGEALRFRSLKSKVQSPKFDRTQDPRLKTQDLDFGCGGINHQTASSPSACCLRPVTALFFASRLSLIVYALCSVIAIILLAGCNGLAGFKTKGGKSGFTQGTNGAYSIEFDQGENSKTPSTQVFEREFTRTINPNRQAHRPVALPPQDSRPKTQDYFDFTIVGPVQERERTVITTKHGTAQDMTGLQKLGAQLENMRPVMYVGIGLMVAAGVLAYFQWWTKAGIALGIGLAMIIAAQSIPGHEGMIIGVGLAAFAVLALLVLYAYSKGKLDHVLPDALDRNPPRKT